MDRVLLIDPQGNNLGEHDYNSAKKIANEKFGLDLVEVRPGVCKILNVGKLSYEASKRKQVKAKPVKEIKFKLNIGQSDFGVKVGHIRKFLKQGHPVRVTIWFSGREVNHPEMGLNMMSNIKVVVEDLGTVSINEELQGKNMYMAIEPLKKVK